MYRFLVSFILFTTNGLLFAQTDYFIENKGQLPKNVAFHLPISLGEHPFLDSFFLRLNSF